MESRHLIVMILSKSEKTSPLRFGRGDMEKVGCRGVSSSGAELDLVQRCYRTSLLKRHWENINIAGGRSTPDWTLTPLSCRVK